MLRRDAIALRLCKVANAGLHIFEKKKPGWCAVFAASSFSKYANSDPCHRNHREGCA